MSVLCPTCHRPMNAYPPIEALKEARLEPQLRKIVDLLAAAYPRAVLVNAIFDSLYGEDPQGGPDNPGNAVKGRVSRLRKRLSPYGWTISHANCGTGSEGRYCLVHLDRQEAAE